MCILNNLPPLTVNPHFDLQMFNPSSSSPTCTRDIHCMSVVGEGSVLCGSGLFLFRFFLLGKFFLVQIKWMTHDPETKSFYLIENVSGNWFPIHCRWFKMKLWTILRLKNPAFWDMGCKWEIDIREYILTWKIQSNKTNRFFWINWMLYHRQ